jgi:hypothetical protein
MRGCREKASRRIHWGMKEVAGGKFVDSKSEFCARHAKVVMDAELHEGYKPEKVEVLA